MDFANESMTCPFINGHGFDGDCPRGDRQLLVLHELRRSPRYQSSFSICAGERRVVARLPTAIKDGTTALTIDENQEATFKFSYITIAYIYRQLYVAYVTSRRPFTDHSNNLSIVAFRNRQQKTAMRGHGGLRF
nr:hypothetical protein [uncultured Shinella sp.]